ncbi:MAG: hypothetical protein IJ262_07520 [Clostridia bacterium]|nr:hypothetical protein [Clostridia bacterium]
MSDQNAFSPEIREKFKTLPSFVQESIMQSGVKFNSVKELDDIAADIIKAADEK